jgi:hypothetical protein
MFPQEFFALFHVNLFYFSCRLFCVCFFLTLAILFYFFLILQVVWKYLHCYSFKCKNQLSCILKTFPMHSKTFQTTINHFVDIWTILQHFFLGLPSGSPKVETFVDFNFWSFIFFFFKTYFGCVSTLFHNSLQKFLTSCCNPHQRSCDPYFLSFVDRS